MEKHVEKIREFVTMFAKVLITFTHPTSQRLKSQSYFSSCKNLNKQRSTFALKSRKLIATRILQLGQNISKF